MSWVVALHFNAKFQNKNPDKSLFHKSGPAPGIGHVLVSKASLMGYLFSALQALFASLSQSWDLRTRWRHLSGGGEAGPHRA
jgi:hypothetical protein